MGKISVDDALERLGGFGLFQWLVFAGIGITEMAVTWQIFLLAFTAAEPGWICRNESTACNFTDVIKVGDDNYEHRCSIPRADWQFVEHFTSIVTEFDLVCKDSMLATLAGMIHFAGWIVGSLLFGYLSDRFGRKIAFLCTAINVSLVAFASSFANTLWLFAFLRFFVGIGIGGKSSLFVIFSEFSAVRHRGTTGVMFWFPFILAVMILPLFAYFIRDWRHLNILVSCLSLPSIIAWWLCPESIRWSLIKGNITDVQKVMRQIAKYNGRPVLFDELETPRQTKVLSSFLDLFKCARLRKFLLLSCFIWFVESAVYYGVSFGSTSLGLNFYLSFFIINSMELPANLVAMWSLNKLGRKKTTLVGMVLATFASVATVIFQMFQREEDASDGFWITRVIMNISARLFITASFSSIWVWSNELFPTVIRNFAMGSTNSVARAGSFLSGYIIWLARIHVLIPYSIFGLLCLLASVACLLLPETKDQPTQEVIKTNEDTLLTPEDHTGV